MKSMQDKATTKGEKELKQDLRLKEGKLIPDPLQCNFLTLQA